MKGFNTELLNYLIYFIHLIILFSLLKSFNYFFFLFKSFNFLFYLFIYLLVNGLQKEKAILFYSFNYFIYFLLF